MGSKVIRQLANRAFALVLLGLTVPAFADDGQQGRDAAFLASLQQAVGDNDQEAVSEMIQYPLRTTHSTIKTPAQFLRNYDTIFNDGVKSAVAGQTADSLFYRDQGVMIGNGEIWFDAFCADGSQSCDTPVDKIFSMNN
jgi:hypothetical protein